MIIKIIVIGILIGLILLLAGKDSKRNNKYNQITESEDVEDEYNY